VNNGEASELIQEINQLLSKEPEAKERMFYTMHSK